MIWLSRKGSPSTTGRSSRQVTRKSLPSSPAWTRKRAAQSSMQSLRSNWRSSSTTFPCSSRDMSRMSLMRPRSCRPETVIFSR